MKRMKAKNQKVIWFDYGSSLLLSITTVDLTISCVILSQAFPKLPSVYIYLQTSVDSKIFEEIWIEIIESLDLIMYLKFKPSAISWLKNEFTIIYVII